MSNPVIALSAGHGYKTKGKRCLKSIDPSETREWYLNDRIMDKVENKLTNYNCTVIRVNDTTGNVDTPLSKRVLTANEANADIYISMHHNAGVSGGTGGGTVVFYYPNGNNSLIAKKLYNHIVKYTNLTGNRSNPVPSTTSLYEVKKPKAKSFLVENGFMDSTVDVPIILTENHAEKTANGVVDFLVEYFNLTRKMGKNTVTTSNSLTYTRTQFIKDIQNAVGVVADGIIGKKTLNALVTVSKSKNNKHAVVKPLQKYLNSLGFNCGTVDGCAGAKFDSATKAWQKANNCIADGEFTKGGKSWKKILGVQ